MKKTTKETETRSFKRYDIVSKIVASAIAHLVIVSHSFLLKNFVKFPLLS
jgi:hypothetical protein